MSAARPSPVHAFTGGRIETMDHRYGDAETVVVAGDRIVDVGVRALLRRHPGATVHDLGGRTLMPGFIDAHNHLSITALHPRWRSVRHAADRDALVAAIRAQAAAEPEAEWVRCVGWDDAVTGFAPDRHDLAAAGTDRPVVVVHQTLHQAVVSSAALDALAIGRDTADPQGGEIVRGPDGEPTGLLVERAWGEAHARSLAAYADPDRWAEHLAVRGRALLALGVTCVHDAACSVEAERVLMGMARARLLPLSVVVMPHAASLLSNDLGGRLRGAPTGEGDEWCRVGAVKLFADGGIAIALDTSIRGVPLRFGVVMEDLAAAARDAIARGFDLAVHAIGNVGVERTVAAFAAARTSGHTGTLRIEHAGVTGPEQWRSLAAVDAVAVVQPGFVEHVGTQSGGVRFDDHHWLAFGGLSDAGVVLAGSSDDPCAPVDPLWCARRGVTRTTASGLVFERDQSIPFDAWLRAYTIGAAAAGGQDHERGSLTPGKRADLVVADLDAADDGRVEETWVAGSCVFSRA